MKRAVFFDRDGVLNEARVVDGTPHPPASLADLRFVHGAREAVRAVRQLGLESVVVTNQPDVARGKQSRAVADAINDEIERSLAIDAVYACFHDSGDGCDCRKPKPGLMLRAAADRDILLAGSYLVGDRHSDIASGRAAGCVTVFLDRGYGETPANVQADVRVASLGEAIAYIVEREGRRDD
ncbi:MAG: D-glycero-alpha-D-manno-heptose-1,7-bisphosphate 7-phosphatase [Vulcanimicrobiaceae bacterium]